jgi:D-amino-acid dehydrogenase
MEQSDVVIIGGGVVGVCTAYYLSERGLGVTLIEQGDIANGSSYGNAGLIVPSHATPLPQPGALTSGLKWMLDSRSPFYIKPRLDLDLARWLLAFTAHCTPGHVRHALPILANLGLASAELYKDLADLFEFGHTHNGLILAYKTEEGLHEGVEEATLLNEVGLNAKTLSAGEAHKMEPSLRTDLAGAIYFPTDAHLNPASFVKGLAGWLEARGRIAIQRNTKVTGLVVAGRRVEKVETSAGEFTGSQVVLAAGSWSPAIVRALNLYLPIQPAKGYSITVKRPAVYPKMPMLLGEARVGVTPMQSPTGDLLRFAGTLELAGMDLSINERRVEAVREAPRGYLQGMDDLETVEVWRGLRPCTPDGLPVIARPKGYDNLTVAAGHAMVGVSLGPITGKLVTQLVCGDKTELDVAPLRMERF